MSQRLDYALGQNVLKILNWPDCSLRVSKLGERVRREKRTICSKRE